MTENLIILLVDKGAREHALAWKLGQGPSVKKVLVFPGNAGTDQAQGHAKISNLEADFEATDYSRLARLATEIGVGLVVVGPDDAVVDGIEGFFKDLEGSKTFAKDFMQKYNIPTAVYRNFDDVESAKVYVQEADHRVVIKADCLAAGKGVVLPETKHEAISELESIMKDDGKFAAAGSSVVIEDKGPNTGGMGVYSPVPFVTEGILDEIDKSILQPTFDGLKRQGNPFVGLLFTGVMITPQGPKVIEYNVQFGDPETQSAMMLLSEDTDLTDVLLACTSGTLDQFSLDIRPGFACNVVVASQGYPGKYATGMPVTLRPCPKEVQIFHAGTYRDRSNHSCLRTGGGRVFSVAAWGNTLQEAVEAAYEGTRSVHFEGMFSRKDIASRSVLTIYNNRELLVILTTCVFLDVYGLDLLKREVIAPPGQDVCRLSCGTHVELRSLEKSHTLLISRESHMKSKLTILAM
ncbi:hypothetical protein LCI18_000077 [Fusarium solani-melongenae]|uniref:Uncharacterized protein n=1 Tax=Fusarium solani subsp. cucurbitae TaxID=2747967 RepID=A0ACD3YJN4_FUSSC|nr:hypothetical protein LCI18_000077 [Fusarium solani-melongenae]